MRNSMLEVMNEDYVTTAFAKGLPEKVVRNKHVGRNAMLPVTTAFGLSLAYAVSGGVLTETVFSWPGIGWEIVNATIKYDYPLVQACFFVLALVVLIMMLVIDILYTFLDPRIRY
jgi:peptide/nickel transport system permease protein